MEVYTSTLSLLIDRLTHSLICSHNARVSHLKRFAGFRAYFSLDDINPTIPKCRFSLKIYLVKLRANKCL